MIKDNATVMNLPRLSRWRIAGLISSAILLVGCSTFQNQLDQGVRLERLGDYEAAIKAYTQAIDLEPTNALAHFNRACVARKLGRLDAAVADFARALDLDPGFAAASMGRAHVLSTRGDYHEAIDDFTRTIRLVPDHVDAYLGRGFAERMIGDDDLALADFDKAVDLDPNSTLAFMSRGNLKAQAGDFNGALDDYIRAVWLDPRSAIARYNSGVSREQTGDLRGAMEDYRKAAELSPDLAVRAKRRLESCESRLSLAVDAAEPAVPPREPESADPFADWESISADDRGTAGGTLAGILDGAGSVRGLSSLVIVHDGRVLAESYFDGLGRNQVRPIRSVTKSVLSLLAGIALRDGAFRSLDQPLGELFPGASESEAGAWRKTTIRTLMELGGGLDWVKKTEWRFTQPNPDQLGLEVDDPTFEGPIDPQETEIYLDVYVYNALRQSQASRNSFLAANTAMADILSLALTRATGLSALEFADRYLFKPLGIVRRRWAKTGVGSSCGSAGLYLRPLDMAKLGRVVTQKGKLAGREYVPSAWIEESLRPRHEAAGLEYGLLWQLEIWDSRAAALATGYGGQGIFCVPELDLVIVTTGAIYPQDSPQGLERQTKRILAYVRNEVFPALLKDLKPSLLSSGKKRASLSLLVQAQYETGFAVTY